MSKDEKRARKEARKAGRYQDASLVDARGNPVSRSSKPRKQKGGKKKKRAKSVGVGAQENLCRTLTAAENPLSHAIAYPIRDRAQGSTATIADG